MRARYFALLGSLVLSVAAGCGSPRGGFDGGHDAGGGDVTLGDTGTGGDARDSGGDTRTDTGRDVTADVPRDVPADVPRDVPADVPRDVPRDVPIDTGPRDTGGGGVCNTCTMDSDCLSACGDPGAGSSWCCVENTCTFISQPMCPAPGQDAGGGGADGFDFGDGFGGTCTFQGCGSPSDCCTDAPCCSQAFGSVCIDPNAFGLPGCI